ncbi:MAG: crossover junction endodeoxyribonuclease RuvC [Patescibacteria group bacterium]
MKIVGIDPGTARVGVGVIEGSKKTSFKALEYFCIETAKDLAIGERLFEIYKALDSKLKIIRPDLLALESLFFNTNPKTAMSVGRASGAILLTAIINNIKVVEYTPLQVKIAITGYGRADKKQVESMVKSSLRLKQIPKPDDISDALAIALCAGYSIL